MFNSIYKCITIC